MSKKKSTYEQLMEDPEFALALEEEEAKLSLSELLIELMEKNDVSVRKLAESAHLTPAVVQGIRSGKRKNASITSVTNIFHALGYEIILKKGREKYTLA